MEDLAVASPATVSRCGMVFNDVLDLGWQPYVDSWLNGRKDKVYIVHLLWEVKLIPRLAYKRAIERQVFITE